MCLCVMCKFLIVERERKKRVTYVYRSLSLLACWALHTNVMRINLPSHSNIWTCTAHSTTATKQYIDISPIRCRLEVFYESIVYLCMCAHAYVYVSVYTHIECPRCSGKFWKPVSENSICAIVFVTLFSGIFMEIFAPKAYEYCFIQNIGLQTNGDADL